MSVSLWQVSVWFPPQIELLLRAESCNIAVRHSTSPCIVLLAHAIRISVAAFLQYRTQH